MTNAELDTLAQTIAEVDVPPRWREYVAWEAAAGMDLQAQQLSRYLSVAVPSIDPSTLKFLDKEARA